MRCSAIQNVEDGGVRGGRGDSVCAIQGESRGFATRYSKSNSELVGVSEWSVVSGRDGGTRRRTDVGYSTGLELSVKRGTMRTSSGEGFLSRSREERIRQETAGYSLRE